ncbi:hypothetical protein JW949_03775 [Candidatus Woesearchaeota archaeon]|nr:hypothetical protein [Candidatus Woesearchaeota archaeon]
MKNKYLIWTPRILGILFAVFISLFAFDVFVEGYAWYQTIAGFLIHLIPTYFVVIALLIAWKFKKELIGGIIYILLGIFYIIMVWGKAELKIAMLIISGPVFIIGILFIINSLLEKKK